MIKPYHPLQDAKKSLRNYKKLKSENIYTIKRKDYEIAFQLKTNVVFIKGLSDYFQKSSKATDRVKSYNSALFENDKDLQQYKD